MPAPTKKNKIQSLTAPERILERTIQIIEELGEAGIRTNPIAVECGVTPPILYRAFHSREGLIIAAQSERYRRATELAAEVLYERIASAKSRKELVTNISEFLDFVFLPDRTGARRLRAEVIGSAISRPELQEAIVKIDSAYGQTMAEAIQPAIDKGWVSPHVDMVDLMRWALSVVNSRISIEFDGNHQLGETWNSLTKSAIMTSVFGDS